MMNNTMNIYKNKKNAKLYTIGTVRGKYLGNGPITAEEYTSGFTANPIVFEPLAFLKINKVSDIKRDYILVGIK